ncbi:Nucleoside 5-triphosphatase RdgB (dHAPTP, dITP, XTP-specific) [Candidatus Sumerlaea chitinivorans]|uniref:dITP/XTP pyrophosphatase n=1 Tax=Sumerlaea chitinivorans TaxID=2250252 RepID=A0A2Z4Y0T7_SUMC1|nr:Nucleoside 5-triphosphatase RdgB (dHAPTP, dITP, XTP-specific) [Candidatus Sumerlaea chitinivorans]
MKELLVATTNQGKVHELEKLLESVTNVQLRSLKDLPDLAVAEEDGATFEANAIAKALHYCRLSGLPTIADDSGLVVDALGGRPGVHSSRYAPSDAERIAKLLREMEGTDWPQRSARFICAAAFAVPNPEVHIHTLTTGILEGYIALEAKGTFGFGYDPIFYVEALGCHLAEVPPEIKNTLSHRAQAIAKLLPAVTEYFRMTL